MKLIARIFAETGIRDMFWLLHSTIKKHGQEAQPSSFATSGFRSIRGTGKRGLT
jgi:hypothetical protein